MQGLSFIAVDLETTGIDERSKIIEIGLIKVIDGEIVGKYEKLINPGTSIPEEITLLTGISDEMVINKPYWSEVEQEILEFLGETLLIAHNVSFDRGFLERSLGIKLKNNWIDTYDLAKILLPTLSSYKLINLAQFLKLKSSTYHRALNDAEVCANIFLNLLELMKKMSPFTLDKVHNILAEENEGMNLILKYIQKYIITKHSFNENISYTRETEKELETLDVSKLNSLDLSEAEIFLKPGGLLSLNNNNYQYRPQQISMLKLIYQSLQNENHAILEAGTGTGKSLAYLLPGLLWALKMEGRIVVATNTIALQEQLFKKDIPFLEKCFGCKFPVALSKGRSNYVCLRRYDMLRMQGKKISWNEKVFLALIQHWLDNTEMGDKEELNLNSFENQIWYQISSQSETCLGNKCSYYNRCYYIKNRRQAEKSNLIVTNHALLLQDVKNDNKILPKYDYVIIDEAHNLEDEATKQFATIIDIDQIIKLCTQLAKGKTSLLNRLQSLVKERLDFIDNGQEMISLTQKIKEEIYSIENKISEIIEYAYGQKELYGLGEIRITQQERESEWWKNLKMLLENLQANISTLNIRLVSIINKIEILEGLEGLLKELIFLENWVLNLRDELKDFIMGQNEDLVYWLEVSNSLKYKNIVFFMAPINVGVLLKEFLFNAKKSVVLTSATLAVSKKLQYTAQIYGLEEVEYVTLIADSPFAYQDQSRICLPTNLPDPSKVSEDEYTKAVISSIKEIIPSVTGGILILFTSYRMLNNVYYELKKDKIFLNKEILAHGKDGSRTSLVETLKNKPNSIVLGTNSFWEGIDVSGIGLTTVIIVKLPFFPPNRPVIAAKMEIIEREGKNSFYKYSLPQAILRFRQGYGRLIRSNKDWGALIVLDNRIITKKYGKEFLKSLPNQPIFKGTLEEICQFLSTWMSNKLK